MNLNPYPHVFDFFKEINVHLTPTQVEWLYEHLQSDIYVEDNNFPTYIFTGKYGVGFTDEGKFTLGGEYDIEIDFIRGGKLFLRTK